MAQHIEEQAMYAIKFSMPAKAIVLCSTLALVAGCEQVKQWDFDLRGLTGNGADTSSATRGASASRPEPDNRGIISYPNYQVAVARDGDTLQAVADRIGVNANELARFNGIRPSDPLRSGEVVALSNRVAEPSPATGASATGPIRAPSSVDVTTLAGSAIDKAEAQAGAAPTASALPQTGVEPIRHRVERGETAFSVARLYGVNVRSLADWNSLGSDLAVREGQFLLIPVAPPAPVAASATKPGAGSNAPTPPSAATPLPSDVPGAADAQDATPQAPDLGTSTTPAAATARFLYPVRGSIIREYKKNVNEGIDIGAPAGTNVKAADAGQVILISKDTDQIPIIIMRHSDGLITVYANVDGLRVKKGDKVKRGETIAKVRATSPSFLHFEVRKGFDSVNPAPYLPK
ncbi:M23 family metallopeptidase [Nereida ignava]|nr:M23 family metallopeptidase [Nereida ignava]